MMSGLTSSPVAGAGGSRPYAAIAASPEEEASPSRHHPNAWLTLWATIWRTTLLIWIPQTAIWYVVASVYPGYTPHDVFVTPAMALIVGCVLGPYLETHLLRFVLYQLRRCLGENRAAGGEGQEERSEKSKEVGVRSHKGTWVRRASYIIPGNPDARPNLTESSCRHHVGRNRGRRRVCPGADDRIASNGHCFDFGPGR